MGLRLRLKSSVDISKLPKQARIVAEAMKRYGVILADNGSPWYISGTPDEHWDNDALHALGRLRGSDFEAVQTAGLMDQRGLGGGPPGRHKATANRAGRGPPGRGSRRWPAGRSGSVDASRASSSSPRSRATSAARTAGAGSRVGRQRAVFAPALAAIRSGT